MIPVHNMEQLMELTATTSVHPKPFRQKVRPLQNGDHLSLAEFKRLYAQHAEIRRAELIEGVVYVASPSYLPHAQAQAAAVAWLGVYHSQTPHTTVTGEQSVQLDANNEVQPDALLWIVDDVEVNEDGLLIGAPNLVVEIAASTASYDLSIKKNIYRRNGVAEYLVFAAYEQQTHWFQLVEGQYQLIPADDDGIYRSRVFPGLWLNNIAFWQNDTAALLATLNTGLASSDHAAFVTQTPTNTGESA